jgi:hypothetical protein
MTRAARVLFLLLIVAGVVPSLFAQANEIALTGGGDFVSNQNSSVQTSWAIEGSVAHRLISAPLIGLYGEIPVAAAFNSKPKVNSACAAVFPPPAGCITQPVNYSSLFVTPGLKLRIGGPGLAPYVVVGGGIGHFSPSGSQGSTTTGVVSYGAGLDITVLPIIGLRGEVRDFNSGFPTFGGGGSGRQHNLFATAGIVLRF